MKKWVMRVVKYTRVGDYYDGKHHTWIMLECGHTASPEWKSQCYLPGKSKARCYMCAYEPTNHLDR